MRGLPTFLVRIAFSSEQGRSLDSTILSRLPGMTPDTLEEILDRSAKAAKAKITQTSPQLEDILQELGEMLTKQEKQDATRKRLSHGSYDRNVRQKRSEGAG